MSIEAMLDQMMRRNKASPPIFMRSPWASTGRKRGGTPPMKGGTVNAIARAHLEVVS
jgi:hypothetical protein